MTTAQYSTTEALPLGDLLSVLRRRRWFIFSLTVLLTALPAAYGMLLMPQYTAEASVIIQPRESRIINVEEVLPKLSADFATVEAQADVIQSRALILRVMTDLDLFEDPEFQPAPNPVMPPVARLTDSALAIEDWLLAYVHRWSTGLVAMAGAGEEPAKLSIASDMLTLPDPLAEAEERDASIEMFASHLNVSQPRESYLLRISFTSVDPTKAARVVNHLISNYLDEQVREKVNATRKANAWLTERLRSMQTDVLKSEHGVAEFQSTNQLTIGRDPSLTSARLNELYRSLNETRANKGEEEAKLRVAGTFNGNDKQLDTIAEVMASPVISNLRAQEAQLIRHEGDLAADYGERHPIRVAAREERAKLDQQIQGEVSRIVQAIRNNILVLSAQEQTLEQQLREATAQSATENEAQVRVRELEREANAKRTLYEALLSRFQETSSQEDLLEPDGRLVAEAEVPSIPSTPSPLIFGAVGFTAATVFSCMLALLREQLDRKLRSGRQIEQQLQTRCLGLVPGIVDLQRQEAVHRRLISKPRSAFTQSVRALYTQLAVAEPQTKVVLITSSLPEEGKTSLATSLAVCAAQISGRRTLLIDFDLWRPGVARAFGLRPWVGVAELIERREPLELTEAIICDQTAGIDLLPAARHEAGSAQLAPQPIHNMLNDLRERYDWIVIDAPPLLGVNDARVLSLYADATIFAVRWEHTSRDAAGAGLRMLREVSAKVAGVVLTRVDMRKYARDGQGDGLEYYNRFCKYYAQ